MSILKIRTYPDPVLQQKAEPLSDFGEETQEFFNNMIETMYTDDGVGLAAPQVGVSKQILIASPTATPGEEFIICNPEIIESEGTEMGQEGCLSFPGIFAQVPRAKKIKLKYQNRNGEAIEEWIDGFFARIIQHEMDHLTGILLIDRVDFVTRQQLLEQYQS